MDLAQGHVTTLAWLNRNNNFSGVEVFNLGIGNGVSIFAIVNAFEKAINKKFPSKYHLEELATYRYFGPMPVKPRKI